MIKRIFILVALVASLQQAYNQSCTRNSQCLNELSTIYGNTTFWWNGFNTSYSTTTINLDTLTSEWQTITRGPGARYKLMIPGHVAGIGHSIFEVIACSNDNIEMGLGGWNRWAQDIDNYTGCSGNYGTNGERAMSAMAAGYDAMIIISGDSAKVLSDSVQIKIRLLYKPGNVNASTNYNPDSLWLGRVYNGLTHYANFYQGNYMHGYGSEPATFTRDFGTGQPGGYSSYMCPDSTCVDDDSFQVVYTKNINLPRGYLRIRSNYTANGGMSLVTNTGAAIVANSTDATAFYAPTPSYGTQWILTFKKRTGSLKTGIDICQMAGDNTYPTTNFFNAYVYNGGTADNYYQGTFSTDSLRLAYIWPSGSTPEALMDTQRCGKTFTNNNEFYINFLGRNLSAKGQYKFRLRVAGLAHLSYLPLGGSGWTYTHYNTNNDLTSTLHTINADTILLRLQYYKYTGTGRISLNFAKQPKNPGSMHSTQDTVCLGGSVTLSVDTVDGTETQWYKNACAGAGIYIGSGATITVTLDSSTTYYARNREYRKLADDTLNVLELISTACASKRIYTNPVPDAPTPPTSQSVCSDTAYTFTFDSIYAGDDGDEVEWATNSDFTSSTIIASPATINHTVAAGERDTIWIRSLTSTTGCQSAAVILTLKVNTLPSGSIIPPQAIIQPGGSVIAEAIGGVSYYWPELDTSIPYVTIIPPVDSAVSEYSVIVTDAFGCSDTSKVKIAVNPYAGTASLSLPTYFEKNLGQFNPLVYYRARLGLSHVAFLKNEVSYFSAKRNEATGELDSTSVAAQIWNMEFVNSDTNSSITPISPKSFYLNYYLGQDTTRWQDHVPVYDSIQINNVYAGIDIKYYNSNEGNLKYDVLVSPHADISQVKMRYKGVESINLLGNGDLQVNTIIGSYTELKPVAYQNIGGTQIPVYISYSITDSTVSFQVDSGYDSDYALTIDPLLLVWSTFTSLPNQEEMRVYSMDVDANYVYYGGRGSDYFPITIITPNIYYSGNTPNNAFAFVAALDLDGAALKYVTIYGGLCYSLCDDYYKTPVVQNWTSAIKVKGNTLHTTGVTGSKYFPLYPAGQTELGNTYFAYYNLGDIFITLFNAYDGKMAYSNHIGGDSWEVSYAIEVDNQGRTVVGGSSSSQEFTAWTVSNFPNQTNEKALLACVNTTTNQIAYFNIYYSSTMSSVKDKPNNSSSCIHDILLLNGDIYAAGSTTIFGTLDKSNGTTISGPSFSASRAIYKGMLLRVDNTGVFKDGKGYEAPTSPDGRSMGILHMAYNPVNDRLVLLGGATIPHLNMFTPFQPGLGAVLDNSLTSYYNFTGAFKTTFNTGDGFIFLADKTPGPTFGAVSQASFIDYDSDELTDYFLDQYAWDRKFPLGGLVVSPVTGNIYVTSMNIAHQTNVHMSPRQTVHPVAQFPYPGCGLYSSYVKNFKIIDLSSDLHTLINRREIGSSNSKSTKYPIPPVWFNGSIYTGYSTGHEGYTTAGAWMETNPGIIDPYKPTERYKGGILMKFEEEDPQIEAGDDQTYVHCEGETYRTFNLGGNSPVPATNTSNNPGYTIVWTANPPDPSLTQLANGYATASPQQTTTYTMTLYASNMQTGDPCVVVTDEVTIAFVDCCVPDNPSLPAGKTVTFSSLTSTELIAAIKTFNSGAYVRGTFIDNEIVDFPYTISINGVLTVTHTIFAPFKITNCHLQFGEGAEIYVGLAKTMEVRGSTLEACGDYLWKGINLSENNGGLAQLLNPTVIISKSTIKDAQYGVWAKNGNMININNTKFINNFVGCYFQGGNTPAKIYSSDIFVRNSFSGTNDFKLPYTFPQEMENTTTQPTINEINLLTGYKRAWAGVQLDNVNHFQVGVPFPGNGLCEIHNGQNSFYEIANGIVSNNSNVSIGSNLFYNILSNGYTKRISSNNLPYQGNAIIAVGSFNTTRRLIFKGIRYGIPFGNSCTPLKEIRFCEKGIITDNMSTDIDGGQISTYQGGIRTQNNLTGSTTIHNNVITSTSYGIYSGHNNPSSVMIDENQIYTFLNASNLYGIYHMDMDFNDVGFTTSSITRNKVDIGAYTKSGISINRALRAFSSQNTVVINSPATTFTGIEYNNCIGLNNLYNFVHSTGTTAHSNPNEIYSPSGIYSNYNFGRINKKIVHKCNSTRDINVGMRFSLFNRNSDITMNHFNFDGTMQQIAGTSNFGLLMDDGDNLDYNQNDKGNKWGGGSVAYTSNGATSLGATSNQFLTSGSSCFGLDDFPPTYSPPGLFDIGPYVCEEKCKYEENPPAFLFASQSNNLSPVEIAIINDSMEYEVFQDEMKWQNEKLVYQRMRHNPSLMDSTANGWVFYNDRNVSPMGMLARLDEQLLVNMTWDSLTWLGFTTIQDSIKATMNMLSELNSIKYSLVYAYRFEADSIANEELTAYSQYLLLLKPTPDVDSLVFDSLQRYMAADTLTPLPYDTTVLDQINEQVVNADSLLQLYTGIWDSLKQISDSIRNIRVDIALDSNALIIPSNEIEAGYVDVNTIYLNTLAREHNVFDSAQLVLLKQLAFRCPMRGGEAVFKARAMLALTIDTYYVDDNICAIDTSTSYKRRMDESQTKLLQVRLYPNPAEDYAILQVSQEMESVQLRILDAVGKTIVDHKISTLNGIYRINTEVFSSGLYYVGLYNDTDKLFGGKLSIFRK